MAIRFDLKDHMCEYQDLTWDAWMERWTASSNYQECMGLLHAIFEAKTEVRTLRGDMQEVERIIFLLTLADQYRSRNPERRNEMVLQGPRGAYAWKAFKLLADALFDTEKPRHSALTLESMDDVLLTALLHFFRPSSSSGYGLENVPSQPGDRVSKFATKYVLWLCQWCYASEKSRHMAHRPEILRILDALGELFSILPCTTVHVSDQRAIDMWKQRFDRRSIQTLEELTHKEDFKSAAEALRRGNQAAQVLALVKATGVLRQ